MVRSCSVQCNLSCFAHCTAVPHRLAVAQAKLNSRPGLRPCQLRGMDGWEGWLEGGGGGRMQETAFMKTIES